ncbi:host attachment protein [Astrobacterium formosum]|uniref:baeRF12 domain-containing protein n=1 Tax=Astrobacterium formosum TaxID=3069710 RepID=UPI003F506F65
MWKREARSRRHHRASSDVDEHQGQIGRLSHSRGQRKKDDAMAKISIPHDAFVFVGDGRKALFLRNDGDEKFPHLKTERVIVGENPPTRAQGADEPGRTFSSSSPGRSSYEQTDWHELEEKNFARDVAGALVKIVRERKVKALIVVAPPKTLAELRNAFHADVKGRIVAEIDKDFTKLPVYEIEKHLTH